MPRAGENFRSSAALLLFFGTTIIGLSLDLWTKSLAVKYLDSDSGTGVYEFIPGWLHFTYTQNHGAVFGLGQGQRPLFIAVSICAIAFLTYLFALSGTRRLYQFMLGMLLAGVLGNMYDRIVFGYVRDMIHALPGIYWPASIARMLPGNWGSESVFPWVFNVADSLLCTGVFLMIVYGLFQKPDEKPLPDAQAQTEQQ
jgi:signal peptidase II